MKSIAIIGGGIAGMSAAFYLEKARRAGNPVTYTLFEATPHLGGLLRSERINGFVIEAGADSFVTEKPWALELCRELEMEDQLVGSNDAGRKTYILVNNRLQPLPSGLQFVVPASVPSIMASPLFSVSAKAQIAGEVEILPRFYEEDESVASFLERHFGKELVERLAEPMLAGVFGGECRHLSAQAVLPSFVEIERQNGSLIRTLQARTRPEDSRSPVFTSFRNGMQQLVDAIAARLDPTCISTESAIESAIFEYGRWQLSFNGVKHHFDALIMALPAHAAAALLSVSCPELSAQLHRIPYTSSTAVALGFQPEALSRQHFQPPPGFGFLVPRAEGRRILACTFVSQKFPNRVPAGALLLRAFLGGARDEAALSLNDQQVAALVREELRSILGLTAEPALTRVFRWPRSMPQYEVGHLSLLAEIERLREQASALALIGNAYRGVGVPDCIRAGRDAAQQIIQRFTRAQPV